MKILVVDDDELVRTMMTKVLDTAGHETEESPDGEDAIIKLQTNMYDIVVTDVVMPNNSGMAVAEFVKTNKLSTSVLAVSAYTNEDDGNILDLMLYYADDVLQKPFDSQTFIKAVNKLTPGQNVESALQNI